MSTSSTLLKPLDPRTRYLLNAAGIAVFLLVLRYVAQKKTKSLNKAPEDTDFDIIIVGGGTSGCVLASRLSEDPSLRVLLLESGGSGQALSLVRIPSGYARLFYTKHIFNLQTETQDSAQGKTKFWPRGRMLGGCSSVNAQMAQYGAPQDFDQWAQYIQDDSWAWKNFRSYFNKFEKYVPDPLYPDVDATNRGSSGPVRVGYFNTVSETSKAFIKACMNIGIPFTPDFNGPESTLGVSRIMTYIDPKGQRVSSESAYLTPNVLARPNLKVILHAHVTRILFETADNVTRAVGVEYAHSVDGVYRQYRARKEVILSAGAVHTPHILLLSGVGPEAQLKMHGVHIVKDVPGVGSNLVDHPVVDLYFKDATGTSPTFLKPQNLPDVFKFARALIQYKLTGKGPFTTNLGESAAFVRTDDPVLLPSDPPTEKLEDTTSGDGSPDLELFCTPLAYKEHGRIMFDIETFALHCYLLRPLSKGNVFLKSSNPFDSPGLNPNYLQNPTDVKKLIRGVRLLLKLAHTEPLNSLLDHTSTRPDLDHQSHLKSDKELEDLVRERVETLYHPIGTCRMAPKEEGGVVDAKLRVYGIEGLRVCDASFFPWIISGHTAGACFAAAEKLADEIKTQYKVV